MSDVKPCPFCGEMPEWQRTSPCQDEPLTWLSCEECGAHSLTAPDDDPMEALSSWNQRPIEDALHAELATREKLIGEMQAALDVAALERDHAVMKLNAEGSYRSAAERERDAAVEEARRLAELAMEARSILLEIRGAKPACCAGCDRMDRWLERWEVKP